MSPYLLYISFQFAPESARYLLAAGRREEALETLRKAAKMNGKSLPRGTLVESQKVYILNFDVFLVDQCKIFFEHNYFINYTVLIDTCVSVGSNKIYVCLRFPDEGT